MDRDRVVLTVGPVDYHWRDVEALGRHTGRWEKFAHQVREGLEAAAAAGTPPDGLEEAADRFRRQRGLLAAEDMEAWLRQRRLTVADWRGWLLRDVLRGGPRRPVGDQEVEAHLWVDGVCSGALRDLAGDLAARAAVHAAAVEQGLVPRPAGTPGPEDLDAGYKQVLAGEQTPQRLADVIRDRRLDWTWVAAARLTLPDRDVAREAAACLRDGMSPDEVARLAATSPSVLTGRLGHLIAPLSAALIGATAGTVVGPVRGNGWEVLRVDERNPPAVGEPDVEELARRVLERRCVEREVDRRVRWRDRV